MMPSIACANAVWSADGITAPSQPVVSQLAPQPAVATSVCAAEVGVKTSTA